jgi:hypothetical protein
MATTVNVYDLENYPDNNKTIIVDHKQVVPVNASGDEKWVISATTTATASGSAAIQDVFIRDFIVGWTKSTAFEQGPYTISASQNALKVAINGSTARAIALTTDTNPISGEAVAADMQTKINDLATVGAVEAGNLAFKNAWVTFENGRFKIQSGSPTSSYTGSSKSSVQVTAGDSNDVSVHLGFFAQVSSEGVAGTDVPETYLSFPYTSSSGLTLIDVSDGSSFSTGDCVGISDGTNTEYRYVSSAAAGVININASLSNSYALNSRVQALRMQDPESKPVSSFESVDDATRFAISSLANQIDFS